MYLSKFSLFVLIDPLFAICTQWPRFCKSVPNDTHFTCISGCFYPMTPLFKSFVPNDPILTVLYWMTPYFCECTNVPNDPYFEHGRGTPLSLHIGSAPPGFMLLLLTFEILTFGHPVSNNRWLLKVFIFMLGHIHTTEHKYHNV